MKRFWSVLSCFLTFLPHRSFIVGLSLSLLVAAMCAAIQSCDSDSTTIVRVESQKDDPPPPHKCEEALKVCLWDCRLIADRRGQAKCENRCWSEFQKCRKQRGRSER